MKKILLTGVRGRGMEVMVDDADFAELSNYKWYISTNGYAQRFAGRDAIFMHRHIMEARGRLNYVDHINFDKLDNRRSNLRICTPQESNRHLPVRKKTASKLKGVSKNTGGWRSRIVVNGSEMFIGNFKSKKEAAQAYNQKAVELFGAYALLNKP